MIINRKKKALASKNMEELKSVKKDLKSAISVCKDIYKKKKEQQLKDNSSKVAWRGLHQMAGLCTRSHSRMKFE